MRVDIWSDLVCPWCYIGKRRLEHALLDFAHRAEVEVVHRSFQLNPSAPLNQTSNRREMLMAKYGRTRPETEEMDARMQQTAARDGLEYHLSADGLTGNTFDAHRLTHLALDRGIQDVAVERFFRGYFTEQRSLFDRQSLTELAIDAGLDRDDVGRVLEDGTYAEAVTHDLREAQALGATGVPFFVIDRRYGVSGAQAVEVFSGALSRAWDARSGRVS
jgi:predicted DsbA family dithiol-disulfide isomerase